MTGIVVTLTPGPTRPPATMTRSTRSVGPLAHVETPQYPELGGGDDGVADGSIGEPDGDGTDVAGTAVDDVVGEVVGEGVGPTLAPGPATQPANARAATTAP